MFNVQREKHVESIVTILVAGFRLRVSGVINGSDTGILPVSAGIRIQKTEVRSLNKTINSRHFCICYVSPRTVSFV